MDNNPFDYIAYFDRAIYSSKYPYYIEMERLLNHNIAMLYYNFTVVNDFRNIIEIQPILITNDKNLYKQYRHVLSEEDFHAFCFDRLTGYNCVKGDYGEQAYQHFLNIKNGEYNRAYQFETHDVWHDSQSGNSYEFVSDAGWKTNNEMFISSTIENDTIQRNNSFDLQ